MPTPIFGIPYAVERLSRQRAVIYALAAGVDGDQARWKPTTDDWSILEVINHLYDEERDDFRTRLDLILHDPTADFPPIDPPLWVIERHYNERDFTESVQNFLSEREKSLAWLRSLEHFDPIAEHRHPQFGSMSAGEMLAAWVAHDCLHIRQLNELHYGYLARTAQPYSVLYAGDW
jgi:hypothetical protein